MKALTADEHRKKSKDWRVFGQEFLGGTDRAAAILGATWLDSRLRILLESFLIDDPATVAPLLKGPLGHFGARCRVAMALGLVSRESFEDLLIIKAVRNAFAHEPPGLTFADDRIAEPCRQLRIPKRRPKFAAPQSPAPGALFEMSVLDLAHRISRSAEAALRRRCRVPASVASRGRRTSA